MPTATVSRLPKFTPSSRLTKPALSPSNSANANAKANANVAMGQAASVNGAHPISAVASRLSNGFYQSCSARSTVSVKQSVRAPVSFAAKWRKENVQDASADFEYKSGKSPTSRKSPVRKTSPRAVPRSKVAQRSGLNCLRQNGPTARSVSPATSITPATVKKQEAQRSHSSDGIGPAQSASLRASDRERSRSLTQVQRPKSRAYSTNRKTITPPTAAATVIVKKPLLQNAGATFKIRAAMLKEVGPVRVQSQPRRNLRRGSIETPSETSPGSSPTAPGSSEASSDHGSQTEASLLVERLEDMSLSSTSSLDHHTSQEYMDDFDNLGNGSVAVLLTSCGNQDDDDSGLDRSRFHNNERGIISNSVSTTTELCFLDDGLDWNHLRLTAAERELRRLRRRRSSQQDFHSQCGSSLDLSPSDSCGSGGTFLWDEEVEPLGGSVLHAHTAPVQVQDRTQPGPNQDQNQTRPEPNRSNSIHAGSLQSEISDVFNELDSCDLDDDDLMLDVDLPEDSKSSEGGAHMAEWRRRQLCWTHTESDFTDSERNQRKGSELTLDLCLNSVKTAALELDVETLLVDCSDVKSQLEHLQKVLFTQDDDADEDTLTTDTLSPETESSSDGTETQVEVLLQEVLQLRQEVRSRDQTIAELSLQLGAVSAASSRCRCEAQRTEVQTQTRETETQSVGSQTSHSTLLPPPPLLFLSPPWQYQRSSPFRTRTKPGLIPVCANKPSDTSVHSQPPGPTEPPIRKSR
uniref:Serine-rich coiled-coil domain-containing protein 2-like n=1 Tax=Knipowitschia caucasica TaxID=637954 RepID=A0AAV2LAZ7_KNICA